VLCALSMSGLLIQLYLLPRKQGKLSAMLRFGEGNAMYNRLRQHACRTTWTLTPIASTACSGAIYNSFTADFRDGGGRGRPGRGNPTRVRTAAYGL
jgi:hypothetical protein